MKRIKFIAITVAVFIATQVLAQANYLGSARPLPKKQINSLEENLKRIVAQTPTRPAHLTVESLMSELDNTGRVNACRLATVVADTDYVRSLDEDGISALATSFVYADSQGNGCGNILKQQILGALSKVNYDETAADFALNSFYAMAAVCMGYNPALQADVQDWAFGQVEAASARTSSTRKGIWAALVLSNLAAASEFEEDATYIMSVQERKAFEEKLKQVIAQYDYLKNEKADYLVAGVKGNISHKDNQTVMLQLFAQVNSFFATKEEDSALKGFITTGGLNGIGRGEEDARFSQAAESFYLHHPTPGTDGKGHWADTANGRKHQILALLVQGLSLSYAAHPQQEGAHLLALFVKDYLKRAPQGGFAHYLFVPLHAMRNGKILFDGMSLLDGWSDEKVLQAQLYQTLKKDYGIIVGMTFAQGAAEVAAEWEIIGKVLGLGIRGIGAGGKAISKAVLSRMSARGLMNLAIVELTGRQAVKVSKAGIKTFMHRAGWKAVAAGGVAVAVGSDISKHQDSLAH